MAHDFAMKRGINLHFQVNHTLPGDLLNHYRTQVEKINGTIVDIMNILVENSFNKVCEGEFEELGASMCVGYHLDIKPDFEIA